MGFREMVKKMQITTGFSEQESKDALEHMVECLAVRLTDDERRHFASQLPELLRNIALTVRSTVENTKPDIIAEFMEVQGITIERAKKQVLSAWKVINEAVSPGEIHDIEAQLPHQTLEQLHPQPTAA